MSLPVFHKNIIMFGKPLVLACDTRCDKAWGIQIRPRVQLGPDDGTVESEDDYAYLADHELGTAPSDPGTYEGGHAKPTCEEERGNKWCARQCERSKTSPTLDDITLPDFSKRQLNALAKHLNDDLGPEYPTPEERQAKLQEHRAHMRRLGF